MKPIAIILAPEVAASVLPSIAFNYAMLSIDRVVTVSEAPSFPAALETRWRAYRDTLQTLIPGEDLPDVGEPDWPVRYSIHDDVVTKSQIVEAGGIRFRQVLATKKKKGAKPRPLYAQHARNRHARLWAREFLSRFGIDAFLEETQKI